MSHKQQIFDKEKVSFNLVVYRKFGKTFEVAVEPDLAIAYKEKKKDNKEDLAELLRAEKIFSDTKKGELAKEEDMQQVFGTTEFFKAAQQMITEGEIQLTAEYREKLRQEKRAKIIQLIHRSAIDPRTNTPHPATRIENAMNEAKIKIDEFKKAEDQVQEITRKLKPIIPIKFDTKTFSIHLDVSHASRLQGFLKGLGTTKKETWLGDGSYICELEIPAGMQGELMDELNSKTHGSAEIKQIKE